IYPRDSYHLASKLPGWLLNGPEDVSRIFHEQLENCRTEYFDFYLLHNIQESTWNSYLINNAYAQMDEYRRQGRIKRLGFSFHGGVELLKEVLAAGQWDFVQLQLNYFDWDYQDSRTKYELCAAAGLQVIVMEPVRGGMLNTLCPEAAALLGNAAPGRSLASWAIRWAASLPNVLCVLSGMSTLEQVEDNTNAMTPFVPLSTAERAALDAALAEFRARKLVPCTGCRYCMPCPAGVDIPAMLRLYNDYRLHGDRVAGLKEDYADLPEPARAEHCIGCGACLAKCPQHIDIRTMMGTVSRLAAQ
ncbi:MAG: aldo/keto reductase, partial [Gemmiger sp.]